MPVVLSVTMAIGALKLSKMKAIVTRLESIEELAGVDILCSDKTGTLTLNQLTLGKPVLIAADSDQSIIITASLASEFDSQDAIDKAVLAVTPMHYPLINKRNIVPITQSTNEVRLKLLIRITFNLSSQKERPKLFSI